MFRNYVLIFIEVNEPEKSSDVKYVSIGTSDLTINEQIFIQSAINTIKGMKNYPLKTTFNPKGLHYFNSLEQYILFLQNQISDYLN